MSTHQTADTVNRFPLEWPLGWQRTRMRRHGQFRHDRRPITMERACWRLQEQLDKLRVTQATLSTNASLTLTGRPRGNDGQLADPGAAVYFTFKKKPTVLACDTYYGLADNIAALAAHLEALRAIERYGVGTIEQALAGYKALPADTAADWRAVFGLARDLRGDAARDALNVAFKARARECHPDVLHDDGAAMVHLNRARDYALAELDG